MKRIEKTGRGGIGTMVLAVAMIALMAGHADAAMPKSSGSVNGNVTVGDVFDGIADDHANHVLAPAPAIGNPLVLNTEDLLRISKAFNLGWQPVAGMASQVIVRRASHALHSDDIEAALRGKLRAELKGKKFDLQMSARNLTLKLPDNIAATLDIASLKYDLLQGDFQAVVTVPAGAEKPYLRKEITGRLYTVSSVPVLKSAVRSGDVITADDIEYIDIRNADLGGNIITDTQKLVGMTPRRGLSPLKPVSLNDIEQPVVVKKGDTVTMLLQSGALQLTTQGHALESGAAGEVVHIINKSSNKVIEAVITGPRTVSVASPAAVLSN